GAGGAAGAGGVGGGDVDADGVADVGGGRGVGLVGGAVDVGAVGAAGVAALPLVGEAWCRVAGPGAGGGGERLSLLRGAADRGWARVGGRRRADGPAAEAVELGASRLDGEVAGARIRRIGRPDDPRPRPAGRCIPALDRRADDD